MKLYKIMESIKLLSKEDKEELNNWLNDLVMEGMNNKLKQSFKRLRSY